VRAIDCWVNVGVGASRERASEPVSYDLCVRQDKVIFASDHPVLQMERCIQEAMALNLREGVLAK
jgi:hypothetical protein